jgi:CRISPR-associated Csx10 family RAMP protein
MTQVAIWIDTVSPLSIRGDHAPGGSETARYIPGSTLLGSLANAHRMKYRERAPQFVQFFLAEQLSYPNMYPASFPSLDDDEMQDIRQPVYPLPKTAQTCKRFPGFLYLSKKEVENNVEQRHGARDTLLYLTVFALLRQQGNEDAALAALEPLIRCEYRNPQTGRQCGETMHHFDGYMSSDSKGHLMLAQLYVRLQTHTGIDREWGTVQETILYNRAVIEEDTRLWGTLKLPNDEQLVGEFTEFVRTASEAGLVRIGTGRTRGLGKVAIQAHTLDEEDRFKTFQTRLENFNAAVQKQAAASGVSELAPFYLAMTLHAPLIYRDHCLRYYASIDGETLAKLSDLPDAFEKDCLYQAASTRRVMGWNDVWGMPKGQELAIETGSVFLYSCTQKLTEQHLRLLFDLEEHGIGQRLSEGYGRVVFSDQFHAEENVR